jgi:hypothetical protein
MRTFFLAAGCAAFLLLYSCKNDGDDVYCDCCQTAPLTDIVQLGFVDTFPGLYDVARVYVPNLLIVDDTPSGNNMFLAFGNEGVWIIESMRVTDGDGDVLFEAKDIPPNDLTYGWDGRRTNGELYVGRFNYEIDVKFIDGHKKTYSGTACGFECGAQDFPEPNRPNCGVPSQNFDGAFDPTVGDGRPDCFQ